MHGYVDIHEFREDIAGFLVIYYLALAVANGVAAWCAGRRIRGESGTRRGWLGRGWLGRGWLGRGWPRWAAALAWWGLAGWFGGMALAAAQQDPTWLALISMPEWLKPAINIASRPTWLTLGTFAALGVMFLGRRFFVRPTVAWLMLNVALLLLGLSLTDPDFVKLVGKPDNVPIVAMFFLTGFFTWLSARRAVQNDARRARGEPPLEALDCEEVLVWPDLVYIELICMVALTALLIVWSIVLKAPLEEPANAVQTPNPSKAPWYFLGLQEMLLYFEPWMAGVVLPGLVLFGLSAIPYLDRNPEGVGYYTIDQRKFAYVIYQFGFLGLWLVLIGIGTFIRGPNWEAFGIYETWDVHRSAALNQQDLSTLVWVRLLDLPHPQLSAGRGLWRGAGQALWRELPGLLLGGLYFAVLPLVLTRYQPFFRGLYHQLGGGRYLVMIGLLLVMCLVPIKMLANWTLDLSYFVSFPEIGFRL